MCYILNISTILPCFQTDFSDRKLPLFEQKYCSVLLNQTPMLKTVTLIARPWELLVLSCLDLLRCESHNKTNKKFSRQQ